MRVLFVSLPLLGHLHPLVPIALALRAAGHGVAFATAPTGVPTMMALGWQAYPIGISISDRSEIERHLPAIRGLTGPEFLRFVQEELFYGLHPQRQMSELLRLIDQCRPDVVVREHA